MADNIAAIARMGHEVLKVVQGVGHSQLLLGGFNKQIETRKKKTIDRHFSSLTESVDASRDVCGTPDQIVTSTETIAENNIHCWNWRKHY